MRLIQPGCVMRGVWLGMSERNPTGTLRGTQYEKRLNAKVSAVAILTSPFDLPPGRLLALDLGQARTGSAVCDADGILATPLAVLRRHATRTEDFAEIAALVAREKAVGVLVGLPLASDGPGEEGLQARWARRYAGRLAGALTVPVAFWDESFSSAEADRLVSEGGGRTPRDAAAAAIILQEYLEARRSAGG